MTTNNMLPPQEGLRVVRVADGQEGQVKTIIRMPSMPFGTFSNERWILIFWDNGVADQICVEDWGKEIIAKEDFQPEIKIPKEINIQALDKVVLTPEARQSILSVLKQQKNFSKIFDKWGLSETLTYGRGMTLLFWGPPGCGKTWAAHCIAEALGQDLKVMENSQIQSCLAGDTEKNLAAAFAEAKKKHQVLLLDECDSLLFSRNSVGMILGREINTLLTEIEKFEGVCILTTNRIRELDKALERRISLVCKFPRPDKDMRLRIWQELIPKKFPMGSDVDLGYLAETEVTGGIIKNILLNAARLAAADDAKEVLRKYFDAAIVTAESSKVAFEKKGREHPVVDYQRNI